jgi:hypothetical protein
MHVRDIVGILPIAITVLLVVVSQLARSAKAVNQPPSLQRPVPVPGLSAPQWQASTLPEAQPAQAWPPQARPQQAWPSQLPPPLPIQPSPVQPRIAPRASVPPRLPQPALPSRFNATAASQEAAITALFATPQALAAAMVGAEVLGPPLSLRER